MRFINASGYATVHAGDMYNNFGPDKAEQIAASLSFPEMHRRQETIHDKLQNTFEWLFEPPNVNTISGSNHDKQYDVQMSFQEWLHGRGSLYWISGKPGSGKSVLMRHLTERLQDQYLTPIFNARRRPGSVDVLTLSFFFWEAGNHLEKSIDGCLRSLLWQTLQNDVLKGIGVRLIGKMAGAVWTRRRLIKCLNNFVAHCGCIVTLVLDGLDECEDADELIDIVQNLLQMPDVKLLLSSRPEPIFKTVFEIYPSLRLQDVNRSDIETFVRKTFSKHPKYRLVADEYTTNSLEQSLVDKADGVFLWVRLVVKSLLKGLDNFDTIDMLHARLRRMPDGMNELYQHMLRRTGDDATLYAAEAALYFRLLRHRGRRINIIEFCFAASHQLRALYLNEQQMWLQTGKNLLLNRLAEHASICTAGMLEVEDNHVGFQSVIYEPTTSDCLDLSTFLRNEGQRSVDFIHRTARDYVYKTTEGQRLTGNSFHSETDFHRTCFESRLITHVVLPALQGANITAEMFKLVLAGHACGSECCVRRLPNNAIDIIKRLSAAIYNRGLMIANCCFANGRYPYRPSDTFPSSPLQRLDIIQLLLYFRRSWEARQELDVVKCSPAWDSSYLSTLWGLAAFSTTESRQAEPHCFIRHMREHSVPLAVNDAFGESMLEQNIEAVLNCVPDYCGLPKGYTPSNITLVAGLISLTHTESDWYIGKKQGANHSFQLRGHFPLPTMVKRFRQDIREGRVSATNARIIIGDWQLALICCHGENGLFECYSVISDDCRMIWDAILDQYSIADLRSEGIGELRLEAKASHDRPPSFLSVVHARCQKSPSLIAAFRHIGKSEDVIWKWFAHRRHLLQLTRPRDLDEWLARTLGGETPPHDLSSGIEIGKIRDRPFAQVSKH